MKALLSSILLAVLLGSSIAFAQADSNKVSLLNPLTFTNRAQCALDSEKPTDSIFLMIDGYNAGKVGHSVAKINGWNTDQYSKKAMQEFRLAVGYMATTIMNKLTRGHLPLLPLNIKTSGLSRYQAVSALCEQNPGNCTELNQYLSEIWRNAGTRKQLEKVDTFSRKHFPLHAEKDRLACYYVKRFSPLQGQLHSPEVNQTNLQEIALAYLNESEYITHCLDADDNLENRYVTLQLDWSTNQNSLGQQGFDYWNSFKIYMSWAWRYSREIYGMSPVFGRLFESIALEESIVFAPNGCKSMVKPSCDSEYLSENSIRELAKINAKSVEHSENVPDGVQQELINKGVRAVNDDFLGTRGMNTAGEWLGNFRKNLVNTRGQIKTKYQAAVQNLNLIQDNLGVQLIAETISSDLRQYGATQQLMNEYYYLCTELRLAGDDKIDFLKTRIDKVADLKNMTQEQYSDRRKISDHINFFRSLSSQVLPLCDQLEKSNFWNKGDYLVNKAGFAPWAKEMLSIQASDTEVPVAKTFKTGSPLLGWKNRNVTAENAICYSGADCARLSVKSIIDLYAVSTYADALVPLAGKVATPNLFNPYSELNSCKIYDPWFNTKRMNKAFMSDLANTALFGWNILPIYIDATASAPRVASFNQLVNNGIIKFDPRLEKSNVQKSLVADFGPLVGAPCAIALNNNGVKNFNFYSFTGLTVNYCDSKESNEVIGNNPNDFVNSKQKARTLCAGCTLNFNAVASAASSTLVGTFNPAKLLVYLFRTFSRYHDAKADKVNIPKSWTVNPAYAAEVYKKYGTIPSHCVDQLGKGLACYSNMCAAQAARYFEVTFGKKAHEVYVRSQDNDSSQFSTSGSLEAWVKSDLCKGETVIKFYCDERKTERFSVQSVYGFTKSCRNAIGR